MKLIAKDIIKSMNIWAQPKFIDTWDNTGFQIGNENNNIKKILISLDLDRKVLDHAIEGDYDMIINHHPVIFKPMKSITTNNHKEKIIYDLIRSNIVVYNAHTNLDQAEGGVSSELAKVLEIKDTRTLTDSEIEDGGYGEIGYISEMSIKDYADLIKKNLSIDHLTIYGNMDKNIKKVAVCGGAGSDFIYDAYKNDADLYITGDIKYHEAQMTDELGITIIDAGHFHTEKVILPVIKEYLEKNLDNDSLIIDIWNEPSPEYCIY